MISSHLPESNRAQLDRAAVNSLVTALSPKVMLVGGEPEPASNGLLLSRVSLFDGEIAYFRVARVESGLAEALRKLCESMAATNKLKGIVLDLRYASGEDHAEAAAVADLFLTKERPLLSWGTVAVKSKQKTDALSWPVAALVNIQTARAAESLAAVLRETGAGLLLGSRTAGQAMMAQEFPLKNGQKLRIATAPILVGQGTALTIEGVKPDISVQVSPEDERAYYADSFRSVTNTNQPTAAGSTSANPDNGTNRARRTRLNESELVREHREGTLLDSERPPRRDREADEAVVLDPTLARALDLLKGLAVVRPSRS